jgi:hypothetical protein
MANLLRIGPPALVHHGKIRNEIPCDRSTRAALELADVDERASASAVRDHEPESLFIVPVADAACESHCCFLSTTNAQVKPNWSA